MILIFAIFILIGAILFNKGEKIEEENKKLSFVFISLSINAYVVPISLFIGGMATDAPNSTMLDFWSGFIVIQGIPLLSLIISIVYFLKQKRKKEQLDKISKSYLIKIPYVTNACIN